MSHNPKAQKRETSSSSPIRARLAALRQAYVAHTLKRAIADVSSTSEGDYRDFGLDKAELLDGLTSLLAVVRAAPDACAPSVAVKPRAPALAATRQLAAGVVGHLRRRHQADATSRPALA